MVSDCGRCVNFRRHPALCISSYLVINIDCSESLTISWFHVVIIGIVSIVLSFRTFGFPLSERLSRLSSSSQPLSCDYQSFSAILPKGATVERVEEVQDGNSYGEGAANLPFPRNPSNLPNLCAVTIHVKTSLKSGYRFGIFLPKAWNSRLLVVGNGGWGGGINWLEMYAFSYSWIL
jgi:hypothetical protein